MRFTRLLFNVHRWLGLLAGLFLLAMGLSGSALVFKPELENALRPTATTGSGPMVSLDAIYRDVARRYPRLRGIAVTHFPQHPADTYELRLYGNDGNPHTYDLHAVYVDPHTGRIVREGSYRQWGGGALNWLLQLHYCGQWGLPGMLLTAGLGLLGLLSCLTGLIVYRKHVLQALLLRVPLSRAAGRRRTSGLHRVVGSWTVLFNSLIFFTGFWMNRSAFESASWVRATQAAAPNVLFPQSAVQLLQAGLAASPLQPTFVYLPTTATGTFRVSGKPAGSPALYGEQAVAVSLNPRTGRVEEVSRASEATGSDWLEAVAPALHFGSVGGWPLRVLYAVGGLAPGVLALSGFALWRRRRFRRALRLVAS
ncbi:PepSY domain-containing protein [Hymenobacter sp. DH14]|uniref:PepSY domain-containing protein n=1 Tax=Hymenobacter cyanobacteriorum TaxID=2926463 RepID=A0A9X1VJ86_9BACT|nr:PepSY-associated TM helix domain-containing protein [Hymenobacter cyanobacteriorum]MCI1189807.1 PepSY domain-containing protein [Hymenobacter cyanobacteriorum]